MSIKNDIKEAVKLWKDASAIFKCLIIVSTILATSSIASLADVVFEWKGFILDGIEFYRNYIIMPVYIVTNFFDIYYEEHAIDIIILYIITTSGFFRVFIPDIIKLDDINFALKIIALFILFNAGIIIYLLYTFANENLSNNEFYSSIIILIALYIYNPHMMGYTINRKIAYFTPFILTIFLVLLLGAINSGLTR